MQKSNDKSTIMKRKYQELTIDIPEGDYVPPDDYLAQRRRHNEEEVETPAKGKKKEEKEEDDYKEYLHRTALPNYPGDKADDCVLSPACIDYKSLGKSDDISTCLASTCLSCSGRGWFPVNVSRISEKLDEDEPSRSRVADKYYRYASCDHFSLNAHRREHRKMKQDDDKRDEILSCCCGVPGSIPEMVPREKVLEMVNLTIRLVPSAARLLAPYARQLLSPHHDTSK